MRLRFLHRGAADQNPLYRSQERRMRVSVVVVGLLALVVFAGLGLGLAGLDAAHARINGQADRLTAQLGQPVVMRTIAFDPAVATFYWQGVLIKSPAVFRFDGMQLRVNNVGALPQSGEAESALLERKFSSVPYVKTLVDAGDNYLTAVNAYGCEVIRLAKRLTLIAKRDRTTTPMSLRRQAEPAELARLGVNPSEITIVEGRVSCPIVGGLPISIPMNATDKELVADPCATPSSAELHADATQLAELVGDALKNSRRTVVLSTHTGIASYEGADAERVLKDISTFNLTYRQHGADAAARSVRGTLVAIDFLVLIAKREEH